MPVTVEEVVLRYLEATCPSAAEAFKNRVPLQNHQEKNQNNASGAIIEDAVRLYNNQETSVHTDEENEPLYKLLGKRIAEDCDVKKSEQVRKKARTETSENKRKAKDIENKGKVTPKKPVAPDSSSDDDEPVRKPLVKANSSPKSNAAAKKPVAPDSSSDDDEPVRKPLVKANSSPKSNAAVKKPVAPDSSSDDDEPVRKPLVKANSSPKSNAAVKKPVAPDSSSDVAVDFGGTGRKRSLSHYEGESEEILRKVPRVEAVDSYRRDRKQPVLGKCVDFSVRGSGSVRRPFQRIDPTKVAFASNDLRDNGPKAEHMALRQNQEMMRVKGKSFNKLKQKNKAKLYASGVDVSVRSFQFEDSE